MWTHYLSVILFIFAGKTVNSCCLYYTTSVFENDIEISYCKNIFVVVVILVKYIIKKREIFDQGS